MKYLKILGLAAIAAAAMMAFAGSASATEVTCENVRCPEPTIIHAESEGHATLDSIIGNVECVSTVEIELTRSGNATETAFGHIKNLTFTRGGVPCTNGTTVTVLRLGTGEIHTEIAGVDNGNGILTSTETEVTIEQSGFHCIFKTNATTLGTVTGSGTTGGNATLDIKATIPRTGGRSGAFCGSSAPWTGSYKVTNPKSLIIH